MKSTQTLFLLLLMLFPSLSLWAVKPSKLLMTGCGMTRLVVVDKETNAIMWSHDLRSNDDCNDIELTKEKNILFAYKFGARMIDWQHRLIWDYPIDKGEECNTATQLPNGHYLLGICGHPDRLVELDKLGKKIKETTFTLDVESVHSHFRQVFPLKSGHYLVPVMGKGELVELSSSGEILKSIKVGGNLFSVKPLKAGRVLVSCGDAHCWCVVDMKKGEVVYKSPSKLGDVQLQFVSEILPLAHGKMIVTNWNGHSSEKGQAAVFETNKENEIVWTLPSSLGIEKVSAVYAYE